MLPVRKPDRAQIERSKANSNRSKARTNVIQFMVKDSNEFLRQFGAAPIDMIHGRGTDGQG